MSKKSQILHLSAMLVLFAVIIAAIILTIKTHSSRYFEATAQSSLSKVLDISELHTLEYHYNSYAVVYAADKVKYAVAYEGIITAGINKPITFDLDEEHKLVTVQVPSAEIIDINVSIPADSINKSVIFTDKKYVNTDYWHKEAFCACRSDLQQKITSDMEFLKIATDNARDAIIALLRPFENQSGYKFTVMTL